MITSPMILDGQEGGFWDVAFDDDAAAAAMVETGGRCITVVIEDDQVSLSAGYEARSPEGRDERSLFRHHRAAIETALAADARVRRLHPAFVVVRSTLAAAA